MGSYPHDLGCWPLHYVSKTGHTEIVKYLVEQGANIEAEDKDNRTPFHYASW